jgi:hemolysin III
MSGERLHSRGEEIANSVSHGVGLVAALAGFPLLVVAATRSGQLAAVVGASVFASSAVLLYLSSTLYHALPESKAKRVFRVLDHGAIFLLIAGTYTPFTLGVLRGAWGYTLFGLVWGLAVLGVVAQSAGGVRFPRLSTAIYLGMGWLVIIAIHPLWVRMSAPG